MAMRLTRSMDVFRPNRTVQIDPRERVLQVELAALGRRAGAEIVDPFAATCVGDSCRVTSETGQPLYKDTSHFNPDWAVSHANFIDMTTAP
jgi:hypothetical protein